jgi:hypothetical protein
MPVTVSTRPPWNGPIRRRAGPDTKMDHLRVRAQSREDYKSKHRRLLPEEPRLVNCWPKWNPSLGRQSKRPADRSPRRITSATSLIWRRSRVWQE